MRLERAEWGTDLPSVESQLETQRHIHASVEDLGSSMKEARMYEVQWGTPGMAPRGGLRALGPALVGHIPGTEVIFTDGASELMQRCPEPSSPPPLPHAELRRKIWGRGSECCCPTWGNGSFSRPSG